MFNVGPYYAQDSYCYRTQDQLVKEFISSIEENLDIKISLPIVKEVCDVCEGHGTINNRSIDGHGLDPNDPDLDEDFWEEYINGDRYRVTCDECNGNNVVDVIDWEAVPSWVNEEWGKFYDAYSDSVGAHLSEMRMGA